ncbi:hypothetical protein FAM19353_01102 [Lacticaseibacillus paracasei]|nr:hypothetical protein FAM19353_01102 [Lacticaseibacillus paracasei]
MSLFYLTSLLHLNCKSVVIENGHQLFWYGVMNQIVFGNVVGQLSDSRHISLIVITFINLFGVGFDKRP